MKSPLKVMLLGKEVGRLVWNKNSRNTYFMYTPAFLQQHQDIAPFTAPVKGIKSRLPIYGEEAQKYQKLPLSCPIHYLMIGEISFSNAGGSIIKSPT